MVSKRKEHAALQCGVAFDPNAGQGAFQSLESTLLAMPVESVSNPNLDIQAAAVAALALVDVVNDPTRKPLFELLPERLFAKDTATKLETAAWAAWYAHTRVLTETAGASGARVDPVLYDASGALLRDLLKLIEYHVGSVPEVAVEIADIRVGAGYQDRATDLVRAAMLWDKWQSEIAGDSRLYRAGDGERARDFAEQIVMALRAHSSESAAAWVDLRSRAFTLVADLYADLYAAGQFLFRKCPEDLALFVPLRRAVVPMRRRAPAPSPEPPTSPAPAPEPPEAPVPAESA